MAARFKDAFEGAKGLNNISPSLIDKEFQKAWLPYFSRSARGHASLHDFEGWLPTLNEVDLLVLMLVNSCSTLPRRKV